MECTVKYTPFLKVILKELNLSIPSFKMIYCQIYHFSLGLRPRELLQARGYIGPYIPLLVILGILYRPL